jgi:hypothetical protein
MTQTNLEIAGSARFFRSLLDRTLHVVERFAIVNDTGAFDNGLHRRLRVAPVSPQRLKAGSF